MNELSETTLLDIAIVADTNRVEPSSTNIDYLADEANYSPSQDAGMKIQDILSKTEFAPDRWVTWHQTISGQLMLSYNLDKIIQEDETMREQAPIRFHNEDAAKHRQRVELFTRRSKLVFMAIANHVGREEVKNKRCKEIVASEMKDKDPISLLNKLRETVRGARAIEIFKLMKQYGDFTQNKETTDYRYIEDYKSLISDMASVGIILSQEVLISKLIGGIGNQHRETKRQLCTLSPQELSTMTIEQVSNLLRASNATLEETHVSIATNQAHAVQIVSTSARDDSKDYRSRSTRSDSRSNRNSSSYRSKEYGRSPSRERRPYRSRSRSNYRGKRDDKDRYSSKASSSKSKNPQRDEDNRPRCGFCNWKGHTSDECKKFKAAKAIENSRTPSANKQPDPTGITSNN